MVITKTLPSEAAKVLDKGVRKMTPGIMTWYQYGEAVLHYMQQVRNLFPANCALFLLVCMLHALHVPLKFTT